MKKIGIIIMILFVTLVKSYGQSAEMRVENESLVSSTVYEFDVYVYNTSGVSWELKAGTIAINMNPSFRNGGTITPTAIGSTSDLSAANQAGGIFFTSNAAFSGNYFRKVVGSAGATLGTTIASGNRVRVARFRLTNSGSFGSASPDLTWRLNATPFAGCSRDNGGVAAILISNTVNAANAINNTYRNGSSEWRTGVSSNATISTTAPSSSSTDVVFLPSSSLSSSSLTCRSLNMMSNATYTVAASGSLNVSGNLSLGTSAGLEGLSSTLVLNGTGTFANQSVTGESNNVLYFQHLTVGTSGQTTTKTLSMPVAISGNVQLAGTATLASGGNLRLRSSASGTGRLLELPAGASVTGNVTVERFIPGASGRRYRYLSAPFLSGPSISNSWQQQVHITGPGTGGTICPTAGVNSNGFDATMSNSASMFTFNETGATNTNVAGSNGGTLYTNAWVTVPNTSSTNLGWGTGYKIFIRGNKSQGCDLLNGTNPAPSNVTLSGTGTVKTGSSSIPVTYSSSNGEGWNLVGNPYPCAIDWDAAGWTKTNMDNMVWIFRPAGNHFSTWNGATGLGANFGSNVIESGNAFFVKANASSPALIATEPVKIGASPATSLFKSNVKALRMVFVKPGELQDELVVAMSPEAQNGLDAMDSEKMSNPSINVYAKDANGHSNAINTIKAAEAQTVVTVGVNSTFSGIHKFSFKGETEFNAYDVLLEDKYLGVIQMINDNPIYQFEVVSSNAATFGENRFSLIFVNRGDFDYLKRIQGIYKNMNGVVNMYPNPTIQTSNVQVPGLTGNVAKVKVYNSLGQELESFTSLITKGNASFNVDLGNNATGVYFIEVSDESGKVSKGKLVKN